MRLLKIQKMKVLTNLLTVDSDSAILYNPTNLKVSKKAPCTEISHHPGQYYIGLQVFLDVSAKRLKN